MSIAAAPPRTLSAPPPPALDPAEGGRRGVPLDRVAPLLVALVIAGAWLAVRPHTVDMAAHVFRAKLFGAEGFTIWDGQWYAGHHTPAYSVLFPPLAWLLGPWLAGALATVVMAALFEPLVRRQWGERARWGALWLAIGTGSLLFTGRLPFALGVTFAIVALLGLQRRKPRLALVAAVASALSSPVAALFLTLAAVVIALVAPRTRGASLALAAAAFVPTALLAYAFPEGGYMPFDVTTYAPIPAVTLIGLVVTPRRERALRAGLVVYALAATAAFAIKTPMGSNAIRLATLFGGPLAACVLAWPRGRARRAVFVALIGGLLFWQWSSPVRDFLASQNEPSAEVSYYKPLLSFLARRRPEDGRVEIPFTRSHWEAAVVAPRFPLARGWERQLDAGRNSLFYAGYLSDFTYANWLAEHAVRFVALPDSKPDESAYIERALIERDPPYLRLIRRLPHWRVYLVTLPHPMVIDEYGADIRLTRLGSDEVTFRVRRAGSALVRVSWSPYWRVDGGCVQQAGGWTRVIARRPGPLRMTTSFSPVRVFSRNTRCA